MRDIYVYHRGEGGEPFLVVKQPDENGPVTVNGVELSDAEWRNLLGRINHTWPKEDA